MTGSGTLADPYIISDVDDLQAMEDHLDAYYELGGDIDASATSGWNGGAGFLPIGQADYFTGQLDGKGYTISDLFISRPTADNVGLFKELISPSIKNFTLSNVNITGRDYVGAAVGTYWGDTNYVFDKLISTGSIAGRTYVGGLFGWLYQYVGQNCYGSNSFSTCTITATGSYVGGFAGWIVEADLRDCYATGNVSAITGDVHTFIGGFAGEISAGNLSRCYAAGDASGTSTNTGVRRVSVGGFVGEVGSAPPNDLTFQDCYARGNATASATNGLEYAGGFIGRLPTVDDIIDNCYSTGIPTGATSGGFCAENSGTISDCFWDTETSGTSVSDGGTGKTTAQMKTRATFTDAGWDFTTPIWYIGATINDGYPAFTLGILLPTVQTLPATAITDDEATLNGTLDSDGGEPCQCRFRYGVTPALGSFTPFVPGITSMMPISATILGLPPGTMHYFQAEAVNSVGTSLGAILSFTTLVAAPTVTTDSVTTLGVQVATLNGTLVNDGGEACACGFEWGKSVAYGTTTPTESKTAVQTFSQTLAPLEPATVYHFRAFARNSAGTAYGADVMFRTYPVPSRGFALSREEM